MLIVYKINKKCKRCLKKKEEVNGLTDHSRGSRSFQRTRNKCLDEVRERLNWSIRQKAW